MWIKSKLSRRVGNTGGAACLIAALLLLSPGVRVVRAEDGAPVSVAPVATIAPAAPTAYPTVHVDDVENARRPGVPAIEIAPGVLVLNTRGYNYGPPPTPLAPEAMKQESDPR